MQNIHDPYENLRLKILSMCRKNIKTILVPLKKKIQFEQKSGE